MANPSLGSHVGARARRWELTRFNPADGLVQPRAEGLQALAKHSLTARSYSATALQHFATCPYRFLLYTVHKLQVREEPVFAEYIDPLSVTAALNYDELVVYDERRVLPVGLILYSGGK